MENKMFELLTKMYSEFTDFRRETRADIKGLQTEIGGLKADIAALKADVAELKADVAVLKSDVAELKADVAALKSDVKGLTERVQALECQMVQFKEETNIKLDALFDGYRQTYELAKENRSKLEILTAKVESHDLEIKALKRKRRVEFA